MTQPHIFLAIYLHLTYLLIHYLKITGDILLYKICSSAHKYLGDIRDFSKYSQFFSLSCVLSMLKVNLN